MVETQLCKLRGTSDTFVRRIWSLWAKPTICLLILSFTKYRSRVFCFILIYERYRSVTPLDAARVNRTIFNNHSLHWYYITLIKGMYYIKHDINVRHGKQKQKSWPCLWEVFSFFFLITFERTQPAASMRPPGLICLFTGIVQRTIVPGNSFWIHLVHISEFRNPLDYTVGQIIAVDSWLRLF